MKKRPTAVNPRDMAKFFAGLTTTAVAVIVCNGAAMADTKTNETKEYLTQLAKLLRGNYFPPPGTEMSRAVVSFTLSCNGTVNSVKIVKPPLLGGHRMAFADRTLTLAVKNVSPLPKPPASLPCPLTLKATFDGTVTSKPFTCKVESSDQKWSSDVVGYTGK